MLGVWPLTRCAGSVASTSNPMQERCMDADIQHAPAAERNKEPIVRVLRQYLPKTGLAFEVAGGTGQHIVHLASQFPDVMWRSSDADESSVRSITARVEKAALPNIHAPILLDVRKGPWPEEQVELLLNINMLHISPWSCALGLLDGAATCVSPGGFLFMYGPYLINGSPTSESNRAFDAMLRERDPRWGLRDLTEVLQEARRRGFVHVCTVPMPANNFSVVLQKR